MVKKGAGFLCAACLLIAACSTVPYSDAKAEFYRGNFKGAAEKLRDHYQKASSKDRLLYLMEAGLMYHADGNYKKSNEIFHMADRIAEEQKTSIGRETLAFLVNDSESAFTGESFERVLIKFYLGLNYLLLREFDKARIQFRRLEYEQQEMRLNEDASSQNLIARYLTGIVSEYAGNYNDARVQYNNILRIDRNRKSVLGDLYVLALREKDDADMEKYAAGRHFIRAYNRQGKPVKFRPEMAEVVIIYQSGKGAEKKSRGKLSGSDEFSAALQSALRNAIISQGVSVSLNFVLAGLSQAENPIPEYIDTNPEAKQPARIRINGQPAGETVLFTDYSAMAISRFEKNYPVLIARNVGNMALKLLTAALAAKAAEEAAKAAMKSLDRNGGLAGSIAGALAGAGTGLAAGYGLGRILAPDLRTWSTLPSNYQVARYFLEPGSYTIEVDAAGMEITGNQNNINLTLVDSDLHILNLRSLPGKNR